MTNADRFYPVGKPGTPWGDDERSAWRERQVRVRSYAEDIVSRVRALEGRYEVQQYGALNYDEVEYPLFALRSSSWDNRLPIALITGGVHGYEISGVLGALHFAEQYGLRYGGRINLLIAPCVSPWAYERVCRWNRNAVDPNRSFYSGGPADESNHLLQLIEPLRGRFLLHVDLHETTDTDESEFSPALAARDGKPYIPESIPDGFYLVDDSDRAQPEFQRAILQSVAKVTHLAPADSDGQIIGYPAITDGLIAYSLRGMGLCASITDAKYATTTEVYPDSPRTTPQECISAQAISASAAMDFALAYP